MEQLPNLIEQLNKHLFWDINISKLDEETSKRLIIERVFSLGNVEDIKKTTVYYGHDIIIKVLRNLNYLDPKTLNFVSIIFETPKNDFKCYMRKQSRPQHWSY